MKHRSFRPIQLASLIALIAALLLSGAPPAAAATPPAYAITDLGKIKDLTGGALDINNNSQVVGIYHDFLGSQRAFLWQNGQRQDLGTLGGIYSQAIAINTTGQIVGLSERTDGTRRPFLWQNGQMQELTAVGGVSGAYDINDSGLIVGEIYNGPNAMTRAFLWQNGQVQHLIDLGVGVSAALELGVNNAGQVVGTSSTVGGFLWQNGQMEALGSFADNPNNDTGTSPMAINDSGIVVGWADSIGPAEHWKQAFLWQNGQMLNLGSIGVSQSDAYAINNLGQAVGVVKVGSSYGIEAALYQNGEVYNLNDLIPGGSGWYLIEARGINDQGQIVGAGLVGDEWHAFMLTPADMPEPDTTAPVIASTIAGTLGANGWYTSNVSVSWSVSDPESSVTTNGCDPVTVTSDTAGQGITCSATSTGGAANATVTVKRDASPPTNISFTGAPAEGATVPFGTPSPSISCTAEDLTSGLQGCSVTGYLTTPGTHTLTATATDKAGNGATATRTYTVQALTLKGFYQPVDMTPTGSAPVWNTVRGGTTVPLKFEVFNGTTELSDPKVVVQPPAVAPVTCDGGTSDDIEVVASGGTTLRYDITNGQFIYNWQTPKTRGCYKITVSTTDGSSLSAFFQLR